MFNLKELAYTKRKSIKRAIARFFYLKNLPVTEEEFDTLVRRTQDSGYNSAIKFLAIYLEKRSTPLQEKRQLLLQFTIEYNTEMYCRQFPQGNKSIERIMEGYKTPEDERFFKEYLYDIVKANKLQLEVVDRYL
ncbi:hypothetical protein CVD28_01505 [Bacillus sp. M6-12]|uniref:hypothetical protein n=1 Tax=Bacillus sp. M6-12 TaxID=2054166 RepID=UPI000C78F55A|nr:hypothetical protein [Bacillus sp. M6-12]PLS19111.1 hypothetical protein CVD28_01505 [Bacillus sp. M6-12]